MAESTSGHEDESVDELGVEGEDRFIDVHAGQVRHHQITEDDVVLPGRHQTSESRAASVADFDLFAWEKALQCSSYPDLVIDEEYLERSSGFDLSTPERNDFLPLRSAWEQDPEGASLSHLAGNLNLSTHCNDDSLAYGQPQSRTLFTAFGRKEGIEDATEILVTDATTRVVDLNDGAAQLIGSCTDTNFVVFSISSRNRL